ncbi:MAG: 1-acyl-sn-glycerol-3-phosphate acyltransferase [Mycobacterium sp.]|jgi:1-acyl-sn-glycerol-3-phosphate acyltransferase|nr:1-acyl-sn-glycerol-3-phosphate acyltransferase [Mycobacterium sp.]
MEPVYRSLEVACTLGLRAVGSKLTLSGLANIPSEGGAVVAINHTSYIDWLPAAMATKPSRRPLRFMIKAEMKDVPGVNFLITRSKTIPVDRSAGAGAYAVAVDNLRAGELVAVYPEATISRSFELKEFKSGAARMALEAQVPIVPMIVWGSHRMWTKDHPRRLGRHKIPIAVAVGEPIAPTGSVAELDATLYTSMARLLDEVIETYPYSPGAHWIPARLGGSAPTPERAAELDAAEEAERARRRAQGGRS